MTSSRYNYRMPNLNAALGCAQMEQLPEFLRIKREIAGEYRAFCAENGIRFVDEPLIRFPIFAQRHRARGRGGRDQFLRVTNENGVMTRPVWTLMNELPCTRTARLEVSIRRNGWPRDR
jgi:dTDP-4-amino-4,6-dideoxygalactose transaminase